MHINQEIWARFSSIREAFCEQPIKRLVSEEDRGGYVDSKILQNKSAFSGGFYEQHCIERLVIDE